jgi:multisubunit Na+/H+ antiporter MnhG subunit
MQIEPAPGVFHAVGETISRATELIQIEFRLAKAELAEKAARAGAGLSLVIVGAILLSAALFLLLQAVVLGLIVAGLSPVAATLLVTVAIKRDSAMVKEKLT